MANDILLRMLLEQLRELAVLLIDLDGRITYWSPGAEQVFGMKAADAVGKDVSVLFTPDDARRLVHVDEMNTALNSNGAMDDRWMARRDGSTFWANGMMVAIRDEAGAPLAFGKVLRNRTDLREQVDALKNDVAAHEERGQRRDLFLSTLSHELRNPLSPLTNAVELIRRTTTSTPELSSLLGVIERQVASLRRLVDDLMDVRRIDAGKVELHRTMIPIQDVINASVESVRPLMQKARHDLQVLMPAAAVMVDVDPARMQQVFVNLLTNAAKYTPDGGCIWVKGAQEGDEAAVHIEDTGVGIPHDMLVRIFDLFTQLEASRKQWHGGLGIGLALVRELVSLHGGIVVARSDGPGRGSVFTVRLPVSPLSGDQAFEPTSRSISD